MYTGKHCVLGDNSSTTTILLYYPEFRKLP